jgi:hypothetical protein
VVDAYGVLGIDRDATPEDLKAAYRRLAHLYHPDRLSAARPDVREEGARRMAEVNAAYEELAGMVGWTVTYETVGWSNQLRAEATRCLLEAGINHTWQDGELLVDKSEEDEVDRIFEIVLAGRVQQTRGRRRW